MLQYDLLVFNASDEDFLNFTLLKWTFRSLTVWKVRFLTGLTCCKQSVICNTRVGPSARTFTPRQPEPGLSLHVLMHCSIGIWSFLVMLAGPSTASAPRKTNTSIFKENCHSFCDECGTKKKYSAPTRDRIPDLRFRNPMIYLWISLKRCVLNPVFI